MHRHYWKRWDLELVGAGRAFEETGFALPRQRLAVDVGWGRSRIFAQPTLFLSHLHMDHALGLPRYAVNRQKMGDGQCRVVVDRRIAADARGIVEAWQRAEGRVDPVEWVLLDPGTPFDLGNNWTLELFEAIHSVPAAGFLLRRRVKRVKAEYAELPAAEIGRLVREGAEPVVEVHEPVFAYAGDTAIEVLDRHPALYEVPVLLLECTFVDALHDEPPEVRGHVHWEEILERADRFANEALVLTHFSRRYPPGLLWRHLSATVPDSLRERLRPLISIGGSDDRRD